MKCALRAGCIRLAYSYTDLSNMKNVLITGASGFIGRPLCSQLLASGCSVRAAVWRNDATERLPADIESTIIDSIGPETVWDSALQGIDTVIHLAARVHVMDEYEGDPLAAYRRVNVAGTQRLALSAAASGVKRLLFLSSVKVNGEETPVPYREDTPPAPQDHYGVSKLEAELVLERISAELGIEVVVIRPPLVYGPRVKANFFKLLHTVARGIPLPLANVKNSRSMIYLGNLLDAVIHCAKHPRAPGKVYLVSDREDVSTPELIRRLAFALGRPVRLLSIPTGLMRIAGSLSGKTTAVDRLLGSLTVDPSRIRAELGWEPPFTMSDGLKATADWYKERFHEHGRI